MSGRGGTRDLGEAHFVRRLQWAGLHNPSYRFNEKAMAPFMEAQIRCVMKYLEG